MDDGRFRLWKRGRALKSVTGYFALMIPADHP
jgi:hypothetical protein